MKEHKNQTTFDIFSFGHILMGQFGALILLPFLFLLSQFIKFEVGFVMLLITIIKGFLWEYFENGVLKKYKIFRKYKFIRKIFKIDIFKVDSWNNCIMDILLVIIGMLMILPFGYLFLPDLGTFLKFGLVPIIGICIVILFLLYKSD